MPMNPRLLRPTSSTLDSDAAVYLNAVAQADGQQLEPAVRKAINDFVVGCKQDNLWSAIKASCILAGARTLNGALTPLRGSAPTNNGPFVSGDYARGGATPGLLGNGTSKYLNTNYAFTSTLQNNRHAAIRVSALQLSASHAYFGSSNAGSGSAFSQLVAANAAETFLISRFADETGNTSATANNVVGFQGLSRSGSASYIRRANQTDQTITQASVSANDNNMFLFARNFGGPSLYTSARLAFYSFGESLSLSLLDARVSALIAAIGAAIP
jgi:hypothetical protein